MLTRNSHPLTRVVIFVSMASIRERRRRDGTKAFAVLWRDPDTGRQTSLTYDDLRAVSYTHLTLPTILLV